MIKFIGLKRKFYIHISIFGAAASIISLSLYFLDIMTLKHIAIIGIVLYFILFTINHIRIHLFLTKIAHETGNYFSDTYELGYKKLSTIYKYHTHNEKIIHHQVIKYIQSKR